MGCRVRAFRRSAVWRSMKCVYGMACGGVRDARCAHDQYGLRTSAGSKTKINYNINPTVPYSGSAIFLHLTQNYKPTSGCVAISLKNFLTLVKYIEPTDKIKIG